MEKGEKKRNSQKARKIEGIKEGKFKYPSESVITLSVNGLDDPVKRHASKTKGYSKVKNKDTPFK